jgi:hypothetical protein
MSAPSKADIKYRRLAGENTIVTKSGSRHLGNGWKEWFEYLELRRVIDSQSHQPVTVLQGSFPDQSALFGVLQKVCDLNLKLISVRRLDSRLD